MKIKKRNKISKNNWINLERLGIISSFLILVLIILMNLISLVSAFSENYYYDIELYYNKGNIEIKNIELEFSQEDLSTNYEDNDTYHIRIIDNKNKVLDKIFFNAPIIILTDIANESGDFVEGRAEELENVSFNVFAPYHENGYQIIVYKNDLEINREFVSQFSKTGFNIEDFLGKNTGKEIIDVNKDKEVDERKKTPGYFSDYKNYIPILTITLIVLIIGLIYFLIREK